jgi:hypothetical protein
MITSCTSCAWFTISPFLGSVPMLLSQNNFALGAYIHNIMYIYIYVYLHHDINTLIHKMHAQMRAIVHTHTKQTRREYPQHSGGPQSHSWYRGLHCRRCCIYSFQRAGMSACVHTYMARIYATHLLCASYPCACTCIRRCVCVYFFLVCVFFLKVGVWYPWRASSVCVCVKCPKGHFQWISEAVVPYHTTYMLTHTHTHKHARMHAGTTGRR